jgi:hypothetical protein
MANLITASRPATRKRRLVQRLRDIRMKPLCLNFRRSLRRRLPGHRAQVEANPTIGVIILTDRKANAQARVTATVSIVHDALLKLRTHRKHFSVSCDVDDDVGDPTASRYKTVLAQISYDVDEIRIMIFSSNLCGFFIDKRGVTAI